MGRKAIRDCGPVFLAMAVVLGMFGRALAADSKASKSASATPGQQKADAPQDEKPSDVPSLESDSGHAKTAKTSKRDPTASAFALPRGTELNDKQKDAMKKLKDRMEPTLRAALEKADKATEPADKRAAAAEIKKIKKEIHDEIDNIVAMAAEEAAKQQTDAMRKAQQAEAMRRAQQQQQNQRYRPVYPNR